ncbi:hypothetical protein ACJJI3_19335 [Microbulbifer sp. ZKSA004]|uniref:hypothetical protein n=1 Tax=Microbulbifer sp. ZKSA004 TaxID=3243389 RepID=UPI00403A564C
MTIYLHSGLHKTGTTAIQCYAYKYRKLLRSKGILYPIIYRNLISIDKGHHLFAHSFSDHPESPPISKGKLLAYDWKSKSQKNNLDLLISAEPICRHTYKTKDCSWIEARHHYLEQLSNTIPPEQTKIILTLRRQDNFAQSLYKEHIMKGVSPLAKLSFKEFLSKIEGRNLNFYKNIAAFKKFFPNIQILIYEQLCNGDLPVNFFRSLGVSGLPNSNKIIRESLSNEEAVLKQTLNQQIHSKAENIKLLKWIKSGSTQNIIKRTLPRSSHLWNSDEDRANFLDRYSQENKKINDEFLSGGKELFPSNHTPPQKKANIITLQPYLIKTLQALSSDIKQLLGEYRFRNIINAIEH